ncbi:hypothetical protein V1504DRAFT_434040 [Lipomyces starkeyi]
MAQLTLQVSGIARRLIAIYTARSGVTLLKTRVPEALILWPKKPDFESRASGDMDAQNAYYNGWMHAYFTTDVFVFSPVSTILYAAINAPGSVHYASVSRELFQKLWHERDDGYWLIADSAFPLTMGCGIGLRLR